MINNPIKDNRIVNDKTFAVRLFQFIKDVQVCDAISDEEKCYLLNVAKSLIDYQLQTVSDEKEIRYLSNIQDLLK